MAAAVEHIGYLRGNSFQTILDAGANKGQFALATRHCHPQAQIWAFEPLAEEAACFGAVFADDTRVILEPFALGSASGEAEIHVSARADSSSLLPIGELQDSFFPGTREAGTRTIEVRRLDEVVSADDLVGSSLLKIDVQGFELELLRGAESLLSHIDAIYVECSFVELYTGQALAADVIAFLSERGFRLEGIYNPSYDADGRAIQADFAFEKVK